MKSEIKKILDYNNSDYVFEIEEEKETKKHKLNGKLITPLEILYLTSLKSCGSIDSVVCARTEVEDSERLSKIFGFEKDAAYFDVLKMNVTIALNENNSEKKRTDHLLASIDGTTVYFQLSSSSDPDEREIVKRIFRGNKLTLENKYSENALVYDDFNNFLNIVKGVENIQWTESILCRECPLGRVEME